MHRLECRIRRVCRQFGRSFSYLSFGGEGKRQRPGNDNELGEVYPADRRPGPGNHVSELGDVYPAACRRGEKEMGDVCPAICGRGRGNHKNKMGDLAS